MINRKDKAALIATAVCLAVAAAGYFVAVQIRAANPDGPTALWWVALSAMFAGIVGLIYPLAYAVWTYEGFLDPKRRPSDGGGGDDG